MISPQDLQSLLQKVVGYLDIGENIAAGVDPSLLPFIAIGKAVEEQIPGTVAAVDAWISGNAPTPQELTDHAAKLAVLSDPNAP